MTGIRIAIAQPEVTNDARKNGALVRKLMRQAAAGKARLVQFPEGLLSGYPKEQLADWSEVDCGWGVGSGWWVGCGGRICTSISGKPVVRSEDAC
ncbi:carbon-nitrogen hydrolase family protein [Kribbella sp. VKM Ac-2568]|uniref:carbon-nitrogen hydrolase family protein n=1 Tax=Kribbella sp. VKM Ac-2568 TaxID=2512219 RepID=UPI0010DAE27D|nr:carbon-nitrogen hydrolase family protein [Kribbella sp. VKM Ac-2568]TCM45668.1 carbon-nitrogen hydrolase [Kribbella sp. VKM Ac-2568]